MLKQHTQVCILLVARLGPAAFRRLCVETNLIALYGVQDEPAAFRRLCVETRLKRLGNKS